MIIINSLNKRYRYSHDKNNEFLNIIFKEYEKLKDEQIQRIGFRDNIIYVTLLTIGGVISFAMSQTNNLISLLLVPWICLLLGWTYLNNDEKISAIGRYIRIKMEERIRKQTSISEREIFGWEIEHRSDVRRLQRKIFQFIIDEITFCFSGLWAIGTYLILDKTIEPLSVVISIIEAIFLIVLGFQFAFYADFKRSRS